MEAADAIAKIAGWGLKLPRLRGSEKQIEWARGLRAQALLAAPHYAGLCWYGHLLDAGTWIEMRGRGTDWIPTYATRGGALSRWARVAAEAAAPAVAELARRERGQTVGDIAEWRAGVERVALGAWDDACALAREPATAATTEALVQAVRGALALAEACFPGAFA